MIHEIVRSATKRVLARGSGRQHKAWGGAQRNPRLMVQDSISPRSGRQSVITRLSPGPRAGLS